MKPLTLIFLGPQGSGKGTQLTLLKQYLTEHDPKRNIVHFEMGKNLRELAQRDNYTGRYSKEILAGGGLIPYAISTSVFSQYLIEHLVTDDEHLLIDGFPRMPSQVPALDSALIDFYKRKSPTVIFLHLSNEEAAKRLLLRGRDDDTTANIDKRLKWSQEQTAQNINWFKSNPAYRVIEIDGRQTVPRVQEDIMKALFNGNY